jgi:hypothetical protein
MMVRLDSEQLAYQNAPQHPYHVDDSWMRMSSAHVFAHVFTFWLRTKWLLIVMRSLPNSMARGAMYPQ